MPEFIHMQNTKQSTKISGFIDCPVYNIAHNTRNRNNIIFYKNISSLHSSPHSFRPTTKFTHKGNSFLKHSIKRKGDSYG